jgi:hypothetical protein
LYPSRASDRRFRAMRNLTSRTLLPRKMSHTANCGTEKCHIQQIVARKNARYCKLPDGTFAGFAGFAARRTAKSTSYPRDQFALRHRPKAGGFGARFASDGRLERYGGGRLCHRVTPTPKVPRTRRPTVEDVQEAVLVVSRGKVPRRLAQLRDGKVIRSNGASPSVRRTNGYQTTLPVLFGWAWRTTT